jgi:hypothetical protein
MHYIIFEMPHDDNPCIHAGRMERKSHNAGSNIVGNLFPFTGQINLNDFKKVMFGTYALSGTAVQICIELFVQRPRTYIPEKFNLNPYCFRDLQFVKYADLSNMECNI